MKKDIKKKQIDNVGAKAILIGLILIPINCYWVIKAEIILATIHATILTMFFNVIFCIFVLTLLNRLIKKYALIYRGCWWDEKI